MIGYLYWFFALAIGIIKGACGKNMSAKVHEHTEAILANSVRMGLCVVIGFFVVLIFEGIYAFRASVAVLLITLLSGVSSAISVVCWVLAVKRGAYMLVDTFSTLGLLIPLLLCSIFFAEPVKLTQWIGFGVLLAAVIIMCSYSSKISMKLTPLSLLLLFLNSVASGFTAFSQKLFVKTAENGSIAQFNFYTYVFAMITLALLYVILKPKNIQQGGEKRFLKSVMPYVTIMSVCLFINSYFITLAANYLNSAQLYPLNTGAGLCCGAVMSSVLFKERLTIRCIIGLVLVFAALVIINVL